MSLILVSITLQSVPFPPAAWLLLGLAMGFATGRLVFGPRLPTALLLRQAELASRGRDSASALAWLAILARRRPRDGELHAERAWHLAQVGRPREAVAAYRRAVRCGWRDAETFLGLAQALRAIGDADAAAEALAAAVALDPTIVDEEP